MINKLKENKGITLIALMITIIVLLILAGVVISMTIKNDGIINKSQTAVETYEIEAIKEEIGRNLATMKMDKIIDGKHLTIPEDLLETAENGGIKTYNNKITDVEENNGKALVMYDEKYIFEIDGNLNVKYLKVAEGVTITTRVSGGGGWIKSSSESTVIISGAIKTKEGTITIATITKEGGTSEDLTLETDGTYSKTITESGTYIIYAKDSNEKEKTRKIMVDIRLDTLEPNDAIVQYTKIKNGKTGEESNINSTDTKITITSGDIVKARITVKDQQTGIDLEKCRWQYSNKKVPIGTNLSNYPSENTFNSETIEIQQELTGSDGARYLHILSCDKAGNYKETVITNPIVIVTGGDGLDVFAVANASDIFEDITGSNVSTKYINNYKVGAKLYRGSVDTWSVAYNSWSAITNASTLYNELNIESISKFNAEFTYQVRRAGNVQASITGFAIYIKYIRR